VRYSAVGVGVSSALQCGGVGVSSALQCGGVHYLVGEGDKPDQEVATEFRLGDFTIAILVVPPIWVRGSLPIWVRGSLPIWVRGSLPIWVRG